MRKKINLTKEFLVQRYLTEEKSSTQIASEVGCCYHHVLSKLREYGIPARKDGIKYGFITKKLLEAEYKHKGTMALAKEFHCSQSVIVRRLKKFGIKPRQPDQFIDLAKRQFGEWTVLERAIDKNDQVAFLCRCSCGKEYVVAGNNLTNGGSTCCRPCCKKKHLGHKHVSWRGYQEISGTFWSRVVASAKKRNLPLEITIEYIWDIYLQQDRRCALTGDLLYFPTNGTNFNDGKYNISLDRIDSNKGYVPGNVQWVTKEVNALKSNLKEDCFFQICKKVVDYAN